MKYFWVLARVCIGLFVAYAGFQKLIQPAENFAAFIRTYEMIPEVIVMPIATILPWLEWLGGALLALGYLTKYSAGLVSILNCSFLLVLLSGLITGSTLGSDCGCFGEASPLKVWHMLVIDSVSFIIAVRLAMRKKFPFSLDALLLKPPKVSKSKMKKRK